MNSQGVIHGWNQLAIFNMNKRFKNVAQIKTLAGINNFLRRLQICAEFLPCFRRENLKYLYFSHWKKICSERIWSLQEKINMALTTAVLSRFYCLSCAFYWRGCLLSRHVGTCVQPIEEQEGIMAGTIMEGACEHMRRSRITPVLVIREVAGVTVRNNPNQGLAQRVMDLACG